MLAVAILLHDQRRVVTALPVQLQVNQIAFDARDDLFNHRAQDALAGRGASALVMPDFLQICAQGEQLRALKFA